METAARWTSDLEPRPAEAGRGARARRKRHERIRWPGVAGLWAQRRRERGVPVGGKWRGHAEERRGDIDSYGERRRGGRERSAGVQLRLV